MTVRELIKALTDMPMDATVTVSAILYSNEAKPPLAEDLNGPVHALRYSDGLAELHADLQSDEILPKIDTGP